MKKKTFFIFGGYRILLISSSLDGKELLKSTEKKELYILCRVRKKYQYIKKVPIKPNLFKGPVSYYQEHCTSNSLVKTKCFCSRCYVKQKELIITLCTCNEES